MKRILRGAFLSDTKFLADINVMDYSLIVGVDSSKNELVVGIVGKFSCSCFQPRHHRQFSRLYSDVHLGQEAGELGQRIRLLDCSWKGRANYYFS